MNPDNPIQQFDQETLQKRYLELTNWVLPKLAQERSFPVQHNHCFQRILLDNLFGCCWYDVLQRSGIPAYKQLSEDQLLQAIAMAEAIVEQPNVYLDQLNQQSLNWRQRRSRLTKKPGRSGDRPGSSELTVGS